MKRETAFVLGFGIGIVVTIVVLFLIIFVSMAKAAPICGVAPGTSDNCVPYGYQSMNVGGGASAQRLAGPGFDKYVPIVQPYVAPVRAANSRSFEPSSAGEGNDSGARSFGGFGRPSAPASHGGSQAGTQPGSYSYQGATISGGDVNVVRGGEVIGTGNYITGTSSGAVHVEGSFLSGSDSVSIRVDR